MTPRNSLKFVCILAAFMAVFAISPAKESFAEETEDERGYGLGLARVSYLTGDALFNSQDDEEWAALSENLTLNEGDRLWAGEGSKIETLFEGGGKAWLNYSSELDIVTLRHDPEGREGDVYRLALVSGAGSFYVMDFDTPDPVFQVDGPSASVAAYGRAYFRMSSAEDGTTQIGVRTGSVEVESKDGSAVTLKKGEMIEVSPEGEMSGVTPLPTKDEWDRWVSTRIKLYKARSESTSYLPPEMRQYANEFDRDSRWVENPDYGWVWVPKVAADWSPYSNGRWVWTAGDFVWLPYDPWYAPFHFGRWRFVARAGWFWVPPLPRQAFWSPGYVGWAWGPDTVCWVPLSPGEIYYGWGRFGPRDVDLHRHGESGFLNVFVNGGVARAVVAVKRDDFIKGRAVRVRIARKTNPFLAGKLAQGWVIGGPPIREFKPVWETRVPRPDIRIPARMLPPKRLIETRGFIKKRTLLRPGDRAVRTGPGIPPAARPGGRLRGAPPAHEPRWGRQPVMPSAPPPRAP